MEDTTVKFSWRSFCNSGYMTYKSQIYLDALESVFPLSEVTTYKYNELIGQNSLIMDIIEYWLSLSVENGLITKKEKTEYYSEIERTLLH